MTRVLIQPAASKAAQEHLKATMTLPVRHPLPEIQQFLADSQIRELESLYPDGQAPIWGIAPGKGRINYATWRQLETGDAVLFTGQGRVFKTGRVAMKTDNPDLARFLWGRDSQGRTWEHVYFLSDVANCDVPYSQLNKAANYAPNFVPQGAIILNQERSDAVIAVLGLGSGSLPSLDQREKDLHSEITTALEETAESLRSQAMGGGPAPKQPVRDSGYRKRNPKVIAYVVKRASGICEGCLQPAPFEKPGGEPYLEVHHVIRLADEGDDSADNAVALCPNCHARAHSSVDRLDVAAHLTSRLAHLEPRVDPAPPDPGVPSWAD